MLRDFCFRVRIELTCAVLLLVIGLRYSWLDSLRARDWVMYGAYWFLMLMSLGCGWLMWNFFRGRSFFDWIISRKFVILGALFFSCLMQIHEPHMLKVNYDEHVLVGISRTMHYEHMAAWPGSAGKYYGSIVSTSLIVDKRPVFFPFLLSLVHTFIGYRVSNVYILNWLIGCVLFYGLLCIGEVFSGVWGGWLLGALMAAVPLVAQNATGGGYDLLNLTLVVILIISVRCYLSHPTGPGLLYSFLIAIFLANTRYESLLYVVVPCSAFVYIWLQRGSVPEFPWVLTLAPLGFLWPLLSNAVFVSTPGFYQMSSEDFINVKNVGHNVPYAIFYLFDPSRGGTNSVWLSGLGCVSLILCFVLLFKRQSRWCSAPLNVAVFFVGAVILANTVLVLMLGWGEWTDPAVSRFTLPFLLLLALSVLVVVKHLERQINLWQIMTFSSFCMVMLFAFSDSSLAVSTNKFKGSFALDWSIGVLRRLDPDRSMLVLANSSIPYINNGYAALPLERPLMRAGQFEATIEYGLYQGVLMVAEQRRSRETGAWLHDPRGQAILNTVEYDVMDQMVFDPFYRVQIIRINKIRNGMAKIAWPKSGPDDGPDVYQRKIYELMPSLGWSPK